MTSSTRSGSRRRYAPPGDQFPLSYVALPPITALDGKGSEGLILRQTYTLTEVRGGQSRILGEGLFAVPSNVGPRTMPDYDALANQGIYALGEKGSEVFVFAGQRDETFYIDLGGTFDTLNLHAPAILSMADDARNDILVNGARDSFSGFNVSSIALAVPIHQVMGPDGNLAIGAYAATSRPRMTLLGDNGRRENSTEFVQVARMGHPLINELIIPTSRKDGWNATPAQSEGQFLTYYCNSALAIALNVVFGTEFPTQNREDLVNALLRYSPGSPVCTSPSTPEEVFADLLRVDLNVPATDPENQKRLGPLAHDATGMPTPDLAGWPNGRRPNDDVTDVALRVVAGYLINPASTPLLGDGVNFNIGATGLGVTSNGIMNLFPFLPRPHNGRDRRHIDPGENP